MSSRSGIVCAVRCMHWPHVSGVAALLLESGVTSLDDILASMESCGECCYITDLKLGAHTSSCGSAAMLRPNCSRDGDATLNARHLQAVAELEASASRFHALVCISSFKC